MSRDQGGAGPLFVYGTLLLPEVTTALLGRVPARRQADLPGHRVAALPGRPYPGLVADPAACASGLLLLDLTPAERRILDAYEGDEYDLRPVTPADGAVAGTYFWLADCLPATWNRADFVARHLPAWLTRLTR